MESHRDLFTALIDAEHDSVLRAAKRATRRADLAEDASQNAWVHAWSKREQVLAAREPRHIVRWLARRHAGMLDRFERTRRIEGRLDRLAEIAATHDDDERDVRERLWAEAQTLPPAFGRASS